MQNNMDESQTVQSEKNTWDDRIKIKQFLSSNNELNSTFLKPLISTWQWG